MKFGIYMDFASLIKAFVAVQVVVFIAADFLT